ncbi:TIGR02300 family protein [Cucumibacter marinus]|uniref:TIGR02300 family protein n=1 Tax=Cucumibacter marinus TaxID=1121252 RepID=UPI00040EE0DB|nr:TIGR02300 family protein [Cucumibacter marinus]
MAKTDRGTKRHCLNCGSKFYDLNRDPIVCPVCGTPFEVATAKASPAKARKEEVVEKETVEEEEPVTTTTGPEVISLDEAGAGDDGDDDDDDDTDNIPDVDDVDDVDDLGDDDDDTFLEDDDEDDGIGIDVPVDKDDET